LSTIPNLQALRQKFRNENERICPKCESRLTIEKTEFFETEICEACLNHAVINQVSKCCSVPVLAPHKLITSNDSIQVRNQCFNCGFVEGQSLGGFTPQQREMLPEVDKLKRDSRDQALIDIRSDFNSQIRSLRQARQDKERNEKNTEWWNNYNAYLASPEWKAKRELVWKRDNYKCQACLTGRAQQVHHKTYGNVDFKGNEPCFDLVSICKPCHDLIHKK
jgi:5-methylcytosine-specific restriction endonuclease McrA